MWVYIYHGQAGQAENYANGDFDVPVTDGQFMFLSEQRTGEMHTYDRSRGQYRGVRYHGDSVEQGVDKHLNVNVQDGGGGASIFDMVRMDYFNCDQWSMCTSDGGSQYSLREDLTVYDDYGDVYDTIQSTEKVKFDIGYGFTQVDLPQYLPGNRVRVSGKVADGGVDVNYGIKCYVNIDTQQYPSDYGINTY